MFNSVYSGKKVLLTGHTGFKGSWLTNWLLRLGAEVVGYSNKIPTEPSLFARAGFADNITDIRADVRNLDDVQAAITSHQPDFVFHLAAQPLVSLSYADPVETFTSNVVGTMNVLEGLRAVTWPCTAVLITSDKCYDNVEWIWGYRESDAIGGKDIYSGSKGAAELVIKSMFHSFFAKDDHPVKLGVTRAGNVIGGGDWALDRIVVDAVQAWSKGHPVSIRSPNATRPWQHVLEPLSGYLRLGQALDENRLYTGEAYNFGPDAAEIRTVSDLLKELFRHWNHETTHDALVVEGHSMQEAGLLKLNCDKALYDLGWTPTLSFAETAKLTADWYRRFYDGERDLRAMCEADLSYYLAAAADRGKSWAA